jgi:uncharacterized protein (TIGR00255 family)
MTGFGTADGPLGGGRLAVEVRTVNHRHFSTQFRLPSELQQFEGDIRQRLRERIERGHAALTARWTDQPLRGTSLQINLERAQEVSRALTELKGALDLPGEVDLGFVARQPDVLHYADSEQPGLDVEEFLRLIDRAVDTVVAMREREGAALGEDLTARLAAIDALLNEVGERAPQRLTGERDRLQRAVAELLNGRPLDESRLSQEIALLADKLDITEEMVRLRTHVGAFREALGSEGGVGRQLSFLGQEILREVNTIGSKANDAAIAQHVIKMKGEVEKIREQVENIE